MALASGCKFFWLCGKLDHTGDAHGRFRRGYCLSAGKMPAGKSSLLWKSLFISTGFLAAYALLTLRAPLFDVLVVALIVLWLVFFKLPVHKAHESGDVKKLEEKMEECC